jgi:AcrR family transcriptional regulator
MSESLLELRCLPTQARAKETFELILDSTAELLEEVGFDGFNTNLLSERAGIGVRAIYRYFPNKYALVNELAGRMANHWRTNLENESALSDSTTDWAELWSSYLDHYVEAVHNTRGGVAVLQAMRAHPELRAVDDAANEAYVADVVSALRSRDAGLTKRKAEAIAKTLLKSTVAVVDATLEEDARTSKQMLDMLKTMHVNEHLARSE